MSDRALLVPGTQASCLADQAGVTVWNAVRIKLKLSREDLGGRPPAQWQALLSMEHAPGQDAPVRTSLLPGTELHASTVVRSPYDRLASIAEMWPYDWRADLFHNAALLLDHLARRQPAGGRWNLVGHSQGCLVIVLAAKLAGPDEFARRVARVALVAPPLGGTMRAGEALLFGRDDLGSDPAVVHAAMAMARTWPSLFQMLPTWAAVVGADGVPLPAARQLTGAEGWSTPPAVSPDMVARAVRFQQALATEPFAGLAGVRTNAIFGKRQDTPLFALRQGDVLSPVTDRGEAGDTLVPYDHTVAWARDDRAVLGTFVAITGKPRDHSFLCQDETTVRLVQRLFAQQAIPVPTPA